MNRPNTPAIAADCIIRLQNQADSPIVLIERKNPPFGWALPGGFMDIGETLESAAIREAKEETSLDVELVTLLGMYSHPKRDSRGHTVTAVYIADANGEPSAADDAAKVLVCTLNNLPDVLAFDHDLILQDYKNYLDTGILAPLR